MDNLLEPGPALTSAYTLFNKLVRDTNSELLFTMTVGEYLWGFQDPIFTALLELLVPDAQSDVFGVFMLVSMDLSL